MQMHLLLAMRGIMPVNQAFAAIDKGNPLEKGPIRTYMAGYRYLTY